MTEPIGDINELIRQYFDKVFILTVPRFKNRHEKVKQRLSGISFEFFYGVDKNDLDENTISLNYSYHKRNSLAVRQIFPPLNKGEIACALSHRNIYQTMVDNGWERILIFEDDVVPDFNTLPLLADCLKQLPEDWELFYLGYLKNEKATLGRIIKQNWYRVMCLTGFSHLPVKMINSMLPKRFSPTLKEAGFHDCTHAYALSLSGAKKLIQKQTPVQHRADNLLSALVMNGELKAFICKSNLFNQEIFTDIADKSFVREGKLK
jgi:glycosyl transferase, family 25